MSEERVYKIGFVGEDLGYFGNIQGELHKKYEELKFDYKIFQEEESFSPEDIFIKIFKSKLDILYIDFGGHFESSIELCKLLRKDNTTKLISTVGLHDYLASNTSIEQALLAGLRLNHKKSAEIHDVIYDPIVVMNNELARMEEYATARLKAEQWIIYQDLRISYATKSHFHVETNTPLVNDQEVFIEEHLLEKIFPARLFKVTNVKDYNLYYNSRFSIDLEYNYEDGVPKPKKKMSPDGEQEPTETIDKDLFIKKMKKEINQWVTENSGSTAPKATKILVIDNGLSIFKKLDKKLSEYPYTINVQTQLKGDQYQIKRSMPNIIAYVFESSPIKKAESSQSAEESKKKDGDTKDKDDEESISDSKNYNGAESLGEIVHAIKQIKDYQPIIIIFNAKNTDASFKQSLSYDKIITYQDALELKVINDMAKIYESKVKEKKDIELDKKVKDLKAKEPNKYAKIKPQDIEPKRVYFKGNDSKGILKMRREVEVISFNECEVYFRTPSEIPAYTVFSVNVPAKMHLTTIPLPQNSAYASDPEVKRALINNTGEEEKKQIRYHLNQIFFRELEEKKKAEKEQYEEAKKKAMAEKAAATKEKPDKTDTE